MSLALTVLLGIVIAALTLTKLPGGVTGGHDKLYHAIAFAALALPLPVVRPRLTPWVLLIAVGYGGLIEVIQPWFGRQADWMDLVADAVGATAGAGIGYALARLRYRAVA
ncbi:VanZ family protein [Sagittula sp. SSi028]|uniref:VanZ family protein n=1 Tax=Sagittula sp. SSi028 TaxID=3400636 RepID=UPI003AF77C75